MAGEHRLHRVLGPVSLTALGIGCIIGAGIFVMTGRAAAEDAGPGVIISFAVAGLGCAFAALCYAEFAAMAPVAGSAYTYAYTTLGEIFAWIIGWDLILEYAMGCATVASAWSNYLNEFLLAVSDKKLSIPAQLLSDPFTHVEGLRGMPWLNLPSVLIMILVTTVLVIGIRESARTNALLVVIKLAVVLFVVVLGWFYVQSAKLDQAMPVTARVLPRRAGDSRNRQESPGRRCRGPMSWTRWANSWTRRIGLHWAAQETERLQKAGKLDESEGENFCRGSPQAGRAASARHAGREGASGAAVAGIRGGARSARGPNRGGCWACWA